MINKILNIVIILQKGKKNYKVFIRIQKRIYASTEEKLSFENRKNLTGIS